VTRASRSRQHCLGRLMFSGLAGAALLKVLEALFNAFGTSLNTWLEKQRTEQALKDLGRVTAERDQQTEAREATERELEAAQNAP
jgi:hypothetical protein